MIHHLRHHRANQAGSTLVLLTAFIVAIFGFAALSLDVGNVFREQRKTSTGTDAGAWGAVILLTNSPQPTLATITQVAADLAAGNGVTATEIAAGARNGFPGAVQLGIWRNAAFLPDTTTNGIYNAVRVPARRTVPLNFGKVVGLGAMTPAVESVAIMDTVGCPQGVAPFGIVASVLGTNQPGSIVVVQQKQGQTGQWGALDINDSTHTSTDWARAMLGGYNGTVCSSNAPDPSVTSDPGANAVKKVMDDLKASGQVIVTPVVTTLDLNASSPVTIVGFVGVKVLDVRGGGSTMEITFQFVNAVIGGTGGGNPGTLFAKTRVLVQ